MYIAGRTDTGRIRSHNEDNYCVGSNFAVVADGMGGHQKGEVASGIVVEHLKECFEKEDFKPSVQNLKNAICSANRVVYRKAVSESEYNGMGTTVVCCVWDESTVYVAHIGDSRCYQITKDRNLQITKDHTLIQTLLDDGQITEKEAKTYPNRHVITKAVGTNPDEEADVSEINIETGMNLLLCSDGLCNYVTDEKIGKIITKNKNIDSAVDTLIATANKNGGKDNITAVLIRF